MDKEDRYSTLILKYEKILDENPRSKVFAPLAEIYRKLGNYEQAKKILKKGLSYNSTYIMGYLCLAECYVDLNESELAFSTLKPLVSGNRENIKLLSLYADVAERLGHIDESLDTFKHLLYLYPNDKEISQKVTQLENRFTVDKIMIEDEFRVNRPIFNDEVLSCDGEELDQWVRMDTTSLETSGWVEKQSDDKLTELIVANKEQGLSHQNMEEYKLQDDQNKKDYIENEQDNDPDDEEQTPLYTLTLVDLYISQNHYQKARQVLQSILKESPTHISARKKLEWLDAQDQINTHETIDSNDDFMVFYDTKMKKTELGENHVILENKLMKLLSGIKSRANIKKSLFSH